MSGPLDPGLGPFASNLLLPHSLRESLKHVGTSIFETQVTRDRLQDGGNVDTVR